MSIKPRIVDRSKDTRVQLHMRVQNDGDFAITGKIIMEIVSPEGPAIRTIEKEIKVGALGIADRYFYQDTAALPKGRFFVNGRFVVNGSEFTSETSKTDFFDVVA
jgi:hypothetical protein